VISTGGLARPQRRRAKVQRAVTRALPALLTLVVVVVVSGNLRAGWPRSAAGWGGEPFEVLLTPPASPLATTEESCSAIGELVAISEQAAALTGSLALIEKDRRAQVASQMAAEIRALQLRAWALSGGTELAGILGDLAEALVGYAGGESSALGNVREASARNARVRQDLYQQKSECGGV